MLPLTLDQLIQLYSWPFPPEEGKIYDEWALRHWAQDVLMASPLRKMVDTQDDEVLRARWIDLAAQSVVGRVLSQYETITRLGTRIDDTAPLHAANQAEIAEFTDRLLSSPPADDLVPAPPVVWIVVGGIRVPLVLQPPPPPPNWGEPGKETPGIALCAIGLRFRQIAQTMEKGSLQDQFTTSGDLLFDSGLARLG